MVYALVQKVDFGEYVSSHLLHSIPVWREVDDYIYVHRTTGCKRNLPFKCYAHECVCVRAGSIGGDGDGAGADGKESGIQRTPESFRWMKR